MRNGLVRDLGDLVHQTRGLLRIALSIGDEDTFVRDDEEAHRGELLLSCRAKLLVGVHAVGKLLDPGKVLVGISALVRIRGADDLFGRGCLRRGTLFRRGGVQATIPIRKGTIPEKASRLAMAVLLRVEDGGLYSIAACGKFPPADRWETPARRLTACSVRPGVSLSLKTSHRPTRRTRNDHVACLGYRGTCRPRLLRGTDAPRAPSQLFQLSPSGGATRNTNSL